jgi:hypothetical protein
MLRQFRLSPGKVKGSFALASSVERGLVATLGLSGEVDVFSVPRITDQIATAAL